MTNQTETTKTEAAQECGGRVDAIARRLARARAEAVEQFWDHLRARGVVPSGRPYLLYDEYMAELQEADSRAIAERLDLPDFDFIAAVLADYIDMQVDGLVESAGRYSTSDVEAQLDLLEQPEPGQGGGRVDPLVMREVDFEMSNFDYEIDAGMAEALMAEPGKVFGCHSGLNFTGRVYFNDGRFHEQVWIYGSPHQTISADTLEELMYEVNSEYGYD